MTQHPIPIYNNLAASTTLGLDWHSGILHQPSLSMYTEADEAPLEERRLKLSMNYYLKTRVCTDNPAYHTLHKFDPITRDLYHPRPNGKGGMTHPPAKPIGLKVEEAMASAEIGIETVCPLKTPTFPPGTHEYEPKRHSLIEGVSKCMIKRLRPNSKSIAMLKDYMMKSTLTDLRLMREWGQQQSSTAINLLWPNDLLAWRRRY